MPAVFILTVLEVILVRLLKEQVLVAVFHRSCLEVAKTKFSVAPLHTDRLMGLPFLGITQLTFTAAQGVGWGGSSGVGAGKARQTVGLWHCFDVCPIMPKIEWPDWGKGRDPQAWRSPAVAGVRQCCSAAAAAAHAGYPRLAPLFAAAALIDAVNSTARRHRASAQEGRRVAIALPAKSYHKLLLCQ